MYSNISSFLPPKEPIYILSSGCSKGKDGVAVHICCQQMSTWIRKRRKRLSDIKLPICKYFIIHSFFLFFFPNSKKERKKKGLEKKIKTTACICQYCQRNIVSKTHVLGYICKRSISQWSRLLPYISIFNIINNLRLNSFSFSQLTDLKTLEWRPLLVRVCSAQIHWQLKGNVCGSTFQIQATQERVWHQ